MNDMDNAKAAREARESVKSRLSSPHGSEDLAERAVKLYLVTQNREEQHDKDDHDDT